LTARRPHRRFALLLGVGVAAGLAAGCTIEKQPRGFYIDDKKVAAIVPGFDSQASVQLMMGNPSISGTFDETTWYYISEMARRKSLSKPKPIRRDIIAVHFAEDGIVTEIEHFTLADGRKIKPRKDTTPTRGRKLGIFEQIFSNVGRFTSAPGTQGPTQ
jgi:outer membrane protein assembly factor BamE (lipoprotein component of BamABCDE complex)